VPATHDVIVVGAGVMGCATARAVARAGRSVLLLEQFRIGHARGSSHGRSRNFRLSYPQAEFVALAREALARWRELESEEGEPLLTATGGLDVGHDVGANARALEECGASWELVDGAAAARRWPAFRLPQKAPVLFQSDTGFVAADRAIAALVRGAVRAGAEVREDARVQEVTSSGVRVGDEKRTGGCVVVTAGPWARGLLARADIDLPTRETRETVAYYALEGPPPPTLVEWDEPAKYALWSPGQGLKVGEHVAGPAADPDEVGTPSAEAVARLSQWVGSRVVGVCPRPHLADTCFYTNAPGERLIVERHGDVVVGSACSGHGFKFAPVIGERLALLAASR
jgi:sarcosine oxidase